MRLGFYTFVCLLSFVFCIPVPELGASSDVPSVYYFSENENAFIAETTDGSNRNTLIDYTLPENNHKIYGAGWSASGRWFSWYSADAAPSIPDSSAYLFDRVTGNQRQLLGGRDNVTDMLWSPVDDVIVVAAQAISELGQPGDIEVFVVDVASEQILNTLSFSHTLFRLAWHPSGAYAIVYIFDSDEMHEMFLLGLDGPTETRAFTQHIGAVFPLVRWSADGKVIYRRAGDRAIVIEDITASRILEMELAEDVAVFTWSPDNSHVLIYTASSNPTVGNLWLAAIADERLTLVDRIVEIAIPRSAGGYQYSSYEIALSYFYVKAWSPDGSYVIYSANEGSLYLFEVASPDMEPIELTDDGRLRSFGWVNDRSAILEIDGDAQDSIIRYSIESGDVDTLAPRGEASDYATGNYFTTSLSPDFRYLAYSSSRLCGFVCIIDVESGQQLFGADDLVAPAQDIVPRGILWHPSSEWFFLLGEYQEQWIVNIAGLADGSPRALAVCALSSACFGWLPEFPTN